MPATTIRFHNFIVCVKRQGQSPLFHCAALGYWGTGLLQQQRPHHLGFSSLEVCIRILHGLWQLHDSGIDVTQLDQQSIHLGRDIIVLRVYVIEANSIPNSLISESAASEACTCTTCRP